MKFTTLLSIAAVATLALAEPRPVIFDASSDADWSIDTDASSNESVNPSQDSATEPSIKDQSITDQDAFTEASRNARVSNDFFNLPQSGSGNNILDSVFAAGTPTEGASKVPNSWLNNRVRNGNTINQLRRLRRALIARQRRQRKLIRQLRRELRRRRLIRRQARQSLQKVRVNRKNGNSLDCLCRRATKRGRRNGNIQSRGKHLGRRKQSNRRRGINTFRRNKRLANRFGNDLFGGRNKRRNKVRRRSRGNRYGLRNRRRNIDDILLRRLEGLGDLFDSDSQKRWGPSRRPLRWRKNKSGRRALGIPSRLRSFCNKLVYVNSRPSYNKSPKTRLLPYTKPQFPATASTTEQGALIIQRNGPARNLPDGALHKYGFQTAVSVQVPRRARLVRFYTHVRFTENPAINSAPNKCRVKNAAVSFFYGAKRVGGRVFRDGSLPVGKWIPVAVTSRGGRLARGPQRITVQAAHNFEGDAECQDGLQLEVRRILTCINTRRTLFQTAAIPEFSVGDEFINDNAMEDANFAISSDAAEWEDALEDDSANNEQAATTIENVDDSADTEASLANDSASSFSQQSLFNEESVNDAQFGISDNISGADFSSNGLTEEDNFEDEGLDEDAAYFALNDSLDADNLEDNGLDLDDLENGEFSLNEETFDEDAIDENSLDEADFAVDNDAVEDNYDEELDQDAAEGDFSTEDGLEEDAAEEDAFDGEFSVEETIDENGANEDGAETEYSEDAQINEDGVEETDYATEQDAAQEEYAEEDSAIDNSDGADQDASQLDTYTEDEGVDESQFSYAQDGYDYDYANLKEAIDAAQASGPAVIIIAPGDKAPPPPPTAATPPPQSARPPAPARPRGPPR